MYGIEANKPAKSHEKVTTVSPSDFFISFTALIFFAPLTERFITKAKTTAVTTAVRKGYIAVYSLYQRATITGKNSTMLKYFITKLNVYAKYVNLI